MSIGMTNIMCIIMNQYMRRVEVVAQGTCCHAFDGGVV